MYGEIIVTGTELLTGRVAEDNGRYAARRLQEAGLTVQCLTILGDGSPLFGDVLRQALGRSRFIIITGGLGPTDDDLTVAQAAAVLGLRLLPDEGLLARMRQWLAARGVPWDQRYSKLALLPAGATILDPGRSACGFSLMCQNVWLFFLPGIPREMWRLFDTAVLPLLAARAGRPAAAARRFLRVAGRVEVEVQKAVDAVLVDFPGVEVGFYPNFPEVHLTLSAQGPDKDPLVKLLDRFVSALSRELGDALLGADGAPLEEVVGRTLRERGQTLAVAESCSGGLICHRLTNISGASDYFLGGVVTYSNQAKMDLLRVPAEILRSRGAVSPECAGAMAQGVRELFHADYGLAVTGIAGPTGGTPEKPVGTVFMGLATPEGIEVRRHHFPGDRDMVKTLTAQTALDWLRRELKTSDFVREGPGVVA